MRSHVGPKRANWINEVPKQLAWLAQKAKPALDPGAGWVTFGVFSACPWLADVRGAAKSFLSLG
ncbi:hypothetical protein CGERO_02255 [Corynebacterium gerontici]|uniref:Uncharacterized protein n=1 Tax=Corynebacterium gerontici TaxID=2079234 RepID=A0A3G6IYB7_9CORY|nr:hypothetical protein CGERO_02255 [Corynebacterium gerontici]